MTLPGMEQPAAQYPTVLCQSADCRAPIIWAITDKEKPMPVDAAPHPDGNVRLSRRGRQVRATVLTRAAARAAAGPSGDQLYRSHFVTCKQAKTWRKP